MSVGNAVFGTFLLLIVIGFAVLAGVLVEAVTADEPSPAPELRYPEPMPVRAPVAVPEPLLARVPVLEPAPIGRHRGEP